MKRYRFYIIIGVLLLLYSVLMIYKPKELNWDITLSKEDKNPYGAYILYHRVKDLFPSADLQGVQVPVYNQLQEVRDSGSAYLLIAPKLNLQQEDVDALLQYVAAGNVAFLATYDLGKIISDTFSIETAEMVRDILRKDSTRINFTNPSLKIDSGYYFRTLTLNRYFKKIDTANTQVLGMMDNTHPDFIRMSVGKGELYIHAAPLCFSNYFMLFKHNSKYTADALSYLPASTKTIYWDQYYTLGPEYSGNLMHYILTHLYLKWAWWVMLLTVIIYLLFESKRRQRVIPELDPMANTSLDFVKTIGNLYFNTRDNKNIALKKITYFLEFVRSKLYLSTTHLDANFITLLARKSRVNHEYVSELVSIILQAQSYESVNDELLYKLNDKIDHFYKLIK